MINLPEVLWAGFGGAVVVATQLLFRLLITDVSKRIAMSLLGIRTFDLATGWLTKNSVWSGIWEIAWHVQSENFASQNCKEGRLYRCFGSVALEGIGVTSAGETLPYVFIGKLSRDNSILTGTWFDKRGAVGGYHGVFQLWLQGAGGTANGVWAGFSNTKAVIKSDVMIWKRIRD